MLAGINVNPIEQLSGTFGAMDSALVNASNELANFTATAPNDVQFFVIDNDTVTIGDASKFEEIEFLLAVNGSQNANITFEYSTGVGTWAPFTPVDGTNGMRNSGVVAWLDGDIPSWALGTGSEYLIRLKRTRNTLTTPPTESLVQIGTADEYKWDKDGDIAINNITIGSSPTGGVAYIGEQNAADVDIADFGQLWVKDEAPNQLWFTDDGGTDHQLTGAGAGSGWVAPATYELVSSDSRNGAFLKVACACGPCNEFGIDYMAATTGKYIVSASSTLSSSSTDGEMGFQILQCCNTLYPTCNDRNGAVCQGSTSAASRQPWYQEHTVCLTVCTTYEFRAQLRSWCGTTTTIDYGLMKIEKAH
jgi:hypothetical protein